MTRQYLCLIRKRIKFRFDGVIDIFEGTANEVRSSDRLSEKRVSAEEDIDLWNVYAHAPCRMSRREEELQREYAEWKFLLVPDKCVGNRLDIDAELRRTCNSCGFRLICNDFGIRKMLFILIQSCSVIGMVVG